MRRFSEAEKQTISGTCVRREFPSTHRQASGRQPVSLGQVPFGHPGASVAVLGSVLS